MASTYLSRTPSTGVNRRTFTFSAWIKRTRIDAYDIIFEASNGSHSFQMATNPTGDGDCIRIYDYTGTTNTTNLDIKTNQAFRDLSAWYHVVIAVDTTQATNTNRAKFYVNGEQVTSLATSTYQSQNHDTGLNNNVPMQIGRQQSSTNYFNGSMAHVHFTDGTAYDASAFGETDATTGIWKPKTAPSVTYGTNGFFLKFENSGAFGTDSSGNSNTFTVNGTMTQTIDTPSNVFATYNPLVISALASMSNGNLQGSVSSTGEKKGVATLGVSSGKYYAEQKVSALSGTLVNWFGIFEINDYAINATGRSLSNGQYNWGYENDGSVDNNGSSHTSGLPTYTTGDIIGVALDLDNGYIYFSKNGTFINSGDPTSGSSGTGGFSVNITDKTYCMGAVPYAFDGTTTVQANFGNGYFGTTAVSSAQNPDDGIGIFEYDVPAGYRALCTKSINAEEYS